jgi:hypothetical protein
MNLFVSASAMAAASSAVPSLQRSKSADALIGAANLLLTDLERGVTIDARALRTAMIAVFGASDAEGAWDWKPPTKPARLHRFCFCASSVLPCESGQRRRPASSPC